MVRPWLLDTNTRNVFSTIKDTWCVHLLLYTVVFIFEIICKYIYRVHPQKIIYLEIYYLEEIYCLFTWHVFLSKIKYLYQFHKRSLSVCLLAEIMR